MYKIHTSFLIVKHSCVREELSDVVFFLQTQIQQITVQEHIFCEFTLAHLTFDACKSPTETFPFNYHSFNGRTMCALDDFQCLIFENSQSSNKFTGKPKIFSDPTSSQKSLKQQINVYIYITHRLHGQWHSPIYPQTWKNTLLGKLLLPCDMYDSYKAFLSDKKTPPKQVATTPLNSTARLTFYLIIQFSRLIFNLSTWKLLVLSTAQV